MNLPPTFESFEAEIARPKTCAREGCTEKGKWSPVIKVWAKGYPKTSAPIRLRAALSVCDAHRSELTAETFWTTEGAARVHDMVTRYGKAEPDFSSSEIEWVPEGTPL